MNKVIIRSIKASGLYGLRTNCVKLEGLSEGINVVYAPNASGKSTLAKAIRLFFKPEKKDLAGAHILATVTTEGVEREVVVQQNAPKFEGVPERIQDYTLDLISMLRGLDAATIGNLEILLGKGVSLKLEPVPEIKKEVEPAKAALAALNAAEAEGLKIADKIPELQSVNENIDRLDQVNTQIEALERVKVNQVRVAKRVDLLAQIDQIADQHPGIRSQTERIEDTPETIQKRVVNAEETVKSNRDRLDAFNPRCPIPKFELTELHKSRITKLAGDLIALRGSLNAEVTHVKRLEAKVNHAASVIEPLLGRGPNGKLIPSGNEIKELIRAARLADDERTALVHFEGINRLKSLWLKDGEPVDPSQESIIRDLVSVLEYSPLVAKDKRATQILGVVGTGIVLAALMPELWMRLGTSILAVIVGLLILRTQSPNSKTQALPEAFARLGIEGEFSRNEIVDRLLKILESKAHYSCEKLIDSMVLEEPSNTQWTAIAQKYGLSENEADAYLLEPVMAHLREFLEASQELSEALPLLIASEESIVSAEADLAEIYGVYEFSWGDSFPEAAQPTFFNWHEAAREYRGNLSKLEAQKQEQLTALDSAGIPDLDSVEERLELLQIRKGDARIFRNLNTELEMLGPITESIFENLSSADAEIVRQVLPEGVPEATTIEYIDQKLRDLKNQVADYQAERDRRTKLQIDIANHLSVSDLDQKREKYSQEVKNLEAIYNAKARKAVDYRITEHLAERLRTRDLPEILLRANAWVSKFTRGRYQIIIGSPETTQSKDVAGTLGPLLVSDEQTGLEQIFDHLSTGTKIHIMLGIRLGLIEEDEKFGIRRFPIITDEATAVSDSHASKAIAEALLEVAKLRQVIFFTNQTSDVFRFKELIPGLKELTIGQGESAGEPMPAEMDENSLIKFEEPSGPGDFDITVAIRRHQPRAILHPNRLGTDSSVRFSEMAAPPRELLANLEATRTQLLDEYPLLTRDALRGQPWISATFAEAVGALADRCKGNGLAFTQGLQSIPRFQKKNEANQWLMENGYLNPLPEPKEIRAIVEDHVARTVNPEEVTHYVDLFLGAYYPS